MAELPLSALFILVPTCHRAPTTTRCSQTCFILLYRSFFQRLKAELLGCCPTAHCTVGMYRTALILEQTVGHFTFLSLSLFSFFFHGHMHGTEDIYMVLEFLSNLAFHQWEAFVWNVFRCRIAGEQQDGKGGADAVRARFPVQQSTSSTGGRNSNCNTSSPAKFAS